jgi:methyltransferase (TIGR00027 family)
MKPGRSSRTAEYMAFFRALESLRPPGARLFTDPFAFYFLRSSLRAAIRLARIPLLSSAVAGYADRRLPGARTSAIARTRWIDDVVCQSLQDGFSRIVILGAGFDCRAHRLPAIAAATVFEVDHPDTLALKRARLLEALPKTAENVRFVEIDFNRQSLQDVLGKLLSDSSRPALFLWEGVTNYLTQDSIDSVLRFVSTCAPGSRLVFTYVHAGALDGSVHFEGAPQILRDVAQIGEPWTFGLFPEAVPAFLRERNLILDRDASARDYRAQYFSARADQMRGYDFYHVALAHVPAAEDSLASLNHATLRSSPHA